MKLKNIEYFGVGLLVASIIGFWPKYFSKLFDGTTEFPYYFHLHTVTATIWIICLIGQPILIRKKQLKWHWIVGRLTYLLVPVIVLSALLLVHYQFHQKHPDPSAKLFRSASSLLIFAYGYLVGIINKKHMLNHARGMVTTGMALLTPATGRIVTLVLGVKGTAGFFLGVAPLYILLFTLIYLERKSDKGRWIFPSVLLLFLGKHIILETSLYPSVWETIALWFFSLPLT